MKWSKIVAKAISDDSSAKLLEETIGEMQSLLDSVRDTEPDVYCEFKSVVMNALYGSPNFGFVVDDDEFANLEEDCG